MNAIKHYQCSYLPKNTKIHFLTLNHFQNKHYKKNQYYTLPFTNQFSKDTQNVIISYTKFENAILQQKHICDNFYITSDIVETSIQELSYDAFILKMPLIVIIDYKQNMKLNKQEYDIYFTNKIIEI